MIGSLEALPALTRRWLDDVKRTDPERYDALAPSLVIGRPGRPSELPFPARVGDTLAVIELSGKQIGQFQFAPAPGDDATAQILAYDRAVRLEFDANTELCFIGSYGSGSIFASPQGIGLLDIDGNRIVALAPDFTRFILAQANAYDAFKGHIVKAKDEASYRGVQERVAKEPAFAGVDVAAIFTAQLKL